MINFLTLEIHQQSKGIWHLSVFLSCLKLAFLILSIFILKGEVLIMTD
jgi:hypothetical protein